MGGGRQWWLFALVFLLLAQAVAAAPDVGTDRGGTDWYEYGRLTLAVSLKDTLTIRADGPNPRVQEVQADLSWFPRESYRQEVLSLTTTPRAEFLPPIYRFTWHRVEPGVLHFGLDAKVRTSRDVLGVTDKVPFPIASLPAAIARYTQETELIDTDEAIRQQALRLAAGKDDLFDVVYAVADWVTTNINYTLNTMTAEATQSSTWVMAHREGVCDELTGLFISMLRSLGIPARFVSGLSYTNLPEFSSPWGGHGWAEVFFPGTGWVPFDVTYGTYGFVDATHVKLQDSLDSRTRSLEFVMKGYAVSLDTAPLATSVTVLDAEQARTRHYTVTLTPFDDAIGLDSYNLLTAKVTNHAPYYLSLRLTLAQTEGLTLFTNPEQNLLLHPHEERTLHWLVRTDGLERNYLYRFPIKLYAGQEAVATTSFEARSLNQEYDREFFDRFLAGAAPEEYTNFTFTCTPAHARRYVGDSFVASCRFTNTGAQPLGGVKLCLRHCETERIPPDATALVSDRITCDSPGAKTFLATATNKLVRADAILRYDCLDEARVAITNLTAPSTLRYEEAGELSFTLQPRSENRPRNLTVQVRHENFVQEWTVEELDAPLRFSLSLRGANLNPGENHCAITVRFVDALGAQGSASADATILLHDLRFSQRLALWLRALGRFVESLLR